MFSRPFSGLLQLRFHYVSITFQLRLHYGSVTNPRDPSPGRCQPSKSRPSTFLFSKISRRILARHLRDASTSPGSPGGSGPSGGVWPGPGIWGRPLRSRGVALGLCAPGAGRGRAPSGARDWVLCCICAQFRGDGDISPAPSFLGSAVVRKDMLTTFPNSNLQEGPLGIWPTPQFMVLPSVGCGRQLGCIVDRVSLRSDLDASHAAGLGRGAFRDNAFKQRARSQGRSDVYCSGLLGRQAGLLIPLKRARASIQAIPCTNLGRSRI